MAPYAARCSLPCPRHEPRSQPPPKHAARTPPRIAPRAPTRVPKLSEPCFSAAVQGYLETSEQVRVFKTFQEEGDVSFDVLISSLADKDADGSENTKQDKAEFTTWLLKVTGDRAAKESVELVCKVHDKVATSVYG